VWTSNIGEKDLSRDTAASVRPILVATDAAQGHSMTSERLTSDRASPADKRPRKGEGDPPLEARTSQAHHLAIGRGSDLAGSELAAVLASPVKRSDATDGASGAEAHQPHLWRRFPPLALEPTLTDRKAIMIAEREQSPPHCDLILPNEVLMLAAGQTTFHVARRWHPAPRYHGDHA